MKGGWGGGIKTEALLRRVVEGVVRKKVREKTMSDLDICIYQADFYAEFIALRVLLISELERVETPLRFVKRYAFKLE